MMVELPDSGCIWYRCFAKRIGYFQKLLIEVQVLDSCNLIKKSPIITYYCALKSIEKQMVWKSIVMLYYF